MIRDHYIDINKLIGNNKILKLFRAVEDHGGVLRFVGGAVRDVLSGMDGFDLDLATDLSPEELVEACSERGLKTVPIGIKFGTVGVVVDNCIVEVTSLRKDVKTDGRRAEVEFTADWEIDAGRRDLTINAVYADEKGNVFDYYNGIDDLEKGVVRFIGSPTQRIKEDYLRIMRFFRFYARFSKGPMDAKALKACVENREGLKTLSMERIRDEFFKILLTDKAAETVKIMSDNEILSSVLPQMHNFDKLDYLIKLINTGVAPQDAVRRLFVLYEPDVALADNLACRMHFSKKQRQSFMDWASIELSLEAFQDNRKIAQIIYLHGKDFALNKLLLLQALALQTLPDLTAKIKFIDDMIMPIFPLRGKDILNHGVENNRQIGTILDSLEQMWMESDFELTRDELLDNIAKVKITQ